MRKGTNRVCEICGKTISPGGMGGHMRLAHGIKVKKVVGDTRDTPDTRKTDLSNTSDVREIKSRNASDVRGIDLSDVSGVREIRPSDYVKKRESVIEQKILPQFPVLTPSLNYVGKLELPYETIPITLAEWESGKVEPAIRNWIEKQAKKHDMTGDEYMKYFDDYLTKHPDVAKSYEIYKPQFVYFGI